MNKENRREGDQRSNRKLNKRNPNSLQKKRRKQERRIGTLPGKRRKSIKRKSWKSTYLRLSEIKSTIRVSNIT